MRFQIVTTDDGYHARIKGGNHETVWATEVYTRKQGAEDAVRLVGEAFWCHPVWRGDGSGLLVASNLGTAVSVDIEYVDERVRS